MRFRTVALFFAFLFVIATIDLLSIRKKTPTYDEWGHYSYGQSILKLNSDRSAANDSKMPISALNALPKHLGLTLTKWKAGRPSRSSMPYGRTVTVLFSLVLAFYVFRWSRELYGTLAGFVSLTLYTFSPNMIAHSRLITTDLYTALFYTLSLYYFWRFLERPSVRTASASSVSLGIAQLAKYSCIFLYPLFALLALLRYGDRAAELLRNGKFKSLGRGLTVSLLTGVFFIAVSIAVINAGFLFNKTGTEFGKYEFESPLSRRLQKEFTWLNPLPVPVPYPFLQGIDMTWQTRKHHHTRIYLLGEIAPKDHGFKGYYLYAFLLKVPLATQIFLLAAILAYLIRRRNFSFRRNEAPLLVPSLALFLYMNLFDTRNIGLRYVLMILPLFFVFSGSLFKGKKWRDLTALQKAPTLLLLAYLIVSNLSYFPHYISYFNEIVWDRKMSYNYLADSNLDWGQDRRYVRQYLDDHPEAAYRPSEPRAGRIVVGANELVGIWDPEKYRWLRENFEPVDHIAYSHLVFNVTENRLWEIRGRLLGLNEEQLKRLMGLERDIEANTKLLQSRSWEGKTPEEAEILTGLGDAHRRLAELRDRDGNLSRAISYYRRAALKTKAIDGERYADITKKLADAYALIAPLRHSRSLFHLAVLSYKEALGVYTKEGHPREYLAMQYALGKALSSLGRMTGDAQYTKEAIASYEEALSLGGAHKDMQDVALTWRYLALAYGELAAKEDARENCKRAMEAHGRAEGLADREKSPREKSPGDGETAGQWEAVMKLCSGKIGTRSEGEEKTTN